MLSLSVFYYSNSILLYFTILYYTILFFNYTILYYTILLYYIILFYYIIEDPFDMFKSNSLVGRTNLTLNLLSLIF